MADHLSKEEELQLGVLVQKSKRALKLKKEQGKQYVYKLNGEELSFQELQKVISEGDKAFSRLLQSYAAFVWSRARIFKAKYPTGPELEDLAQEGFIGLVRAINKYDPTRGNKLSTVAFYWIDQAISRSSNKTGRLIRLPENRIADFVKISRIRARYEDSDLSADEVDELAREELHLSKEDFVNILTAASMPISLNRPMGSDGDDSKELMDFVSNNSTASSSEESVVSDMMMDLLNDKLKELSEEEQAVITSSFLLGTGTHKRTSIAEVKENYSMTSQKFKRTLNTALNKLKKELSSLDISFEDFLS